MIVVAVRGKSEGQPFPRLIRRMEGEGGRQKSRMGGNERWKLCEREGEERWTGVMVGGGEVGR